MPIEHKWWVPVAVLLALAVLQALKMLKHPVDADAGGYVPKLTDKSTYPKAYVHGVGAYALMLTMMVFSLPWLWALLITVAAGYLYERIQGFVNKWDVIADVAGAMLAIVITLIALGQLVAV
jgi:hypothetical protein